MELISFFSPNSIAVIGASRHPQKIGYGLVKNIIESGYKGKIYPINPQATDILKLPCFSNLTQIPLIPDLTIIAIPAILVPETVKNAAERGVKNFVIISAGFKEIGKEGEKLENDLKDLINSYNLHILGPNCLGLINTNINLNATFSNAYPKAGKIAFASQSGALCTAVLDWSEMRQIGFSYFVSLGNKISITEIELLEFWEKDPSVACIALYLEEIREGKKFLKIAQSVSLKKPIIIMHPGQSQEAKQAISSHTGSIAGERQAMLTAFWEAGLVQADSLEDLFDYLTIFSMRHIPEGRKVALVTNAGGPAILTTDEIIKQGLQIAPLGAQTIERLKEKLPRIINLRDPLDLIGDALASRFGDGLQEILSEKEVETVIVLLTPQIMTEIEETASIIGKLSKKYDKPIITAFMGGRSLEKGINILQEHQIPNFSFPERAVNALKKIIEYSEWKVKAVEWAPVIINDGKKAISTMTETQRIQHVLTKTHENQNGFLTDQEAFEILRSFSFPLPQLGFANNAAGAATMARFLQLPVVLKVSCTDIIHKSDMGGVRTGLDDFDKVGRAAKELDDLMRQKGYQQKDWSFIIQKMVEADYEIIVGVKKDPSFGHLIMFGAGGIYTEIYKDVAFGLVPLNQAKALEMIRETKIVSILEGARGRNPVDLIKIADLMVKVSDLLITFPQITEMDFNPVLVKHDQIWIVDAKIKV